MDADTTGALIEGQLAAPSLPPALAAMHGKSTAEILAELNKSPLFMTELEENDELEAFRALAYEGSPTEVALNFKERGNECFKEANWRDAKEFYSKGIQVLQLEERRIRDMGEKAQQQPQVQAQAQSDYSKYVDKDKDKEKDKEDDQLPTALLETLLVNRAASHLALKNYRACTLDCTHALTLNPSNLKAHYRCATALLSLTKLPEASAICSRGLSLSPTNPPLLTLSAQIQTATAALQQKSLLAHSAAAQKHKELLVLRAALKARGMRTRSTPNPPEMHGAAVALHPDPADPASELTFPTLLLYPLMLQSDFVPAMAETELLGERLADVLSVPPDWDAGKEYTAKGVECFVETANGGLVKVGRKVTLLGLLGDVDIEEEGERKKGPVVEVVDGVVSIFVLPKAKASAWVAEWKTKKSKGKGG